MESFNWECRTKVRFGEGCVRKYLEPLVREFLPGSGDVIGGGAAGSGGAAAARDSAAVMVAGADAATAGRASAAAAPAACRGDCRLPAGAAPTEAIEGAVPAAAPMTTGQSAAPAGHGRTGKCRRNILIGYGGGSVKRNGSYDDVLDVLEGMGFRRTTAGLPETAPTGLIYEFPGIMSNPTLAKMQEGAKFARENNIGLIIAIGGGSVMDCCKAISVQALYDGDAWNDFWMEGKPMTHEIIPCGVVVTMPATGSEVNGCAVLTNEETHIKCDRDYTEQMPVFALMDPAYTLTMPLRQLRAGTFDILSHIMETYFSYPIEGNPSDDTSEGLMRGLIRDFRAAIRDPQDMQARSNIMWHASLAENRIIKMGKSKDFQAHNMEHQLSAYTNCNHGEGLAVLHPAYYRHIYKDGLGKFTAWAENVWRLDPRDYGSDEELALAGIDALESFIREMGLPTTLRELGMSDKEKEILPEIAESCFISEGAFRPLTHSEILEIYGECW